jgi:putative ABC transport system permease protein
MSWIDGLRHRLRTVLRPGAYDAELQEEMRFHEELGAEQQGDVGRARRRFGNRDYYREETRRMTWLGSLDVLRQDATYARRSITRAPALTFMIVLTLALGIGVNAATFAVLDRLYVRPPGGVTDPSSLRRLWLELHLRGGPFTAQLMNYPQYRTIASGSGDGAEVAVYTPPGMVRLGRGVQAPKVAVKHASANYFAVLGVRPALGRFYTPDEDRLGDAAAVAVVSHAFWRSRLAADPAAIGRTIELGREVYTVIGVADRSFAGIDLQPVDVWIPLGGLRAQPSWWETPHMYVFRAVRRARPGEVPGDFERRATVLVNNVNRELMPARPDTLMRVLDGSIIEARGPGKARQAELISTRLSGVAVIVLLIAGANVINLLLARAVRRRRETAVRVALGVSRWRLVRLLTTETLLLAAIAAIVALVAGWWGGTLLRALLLPDVAWLGSTLDTRVAAYTVAVAIVAGLVAGIVPALQSSNPDVTTALKAGARDGLRQRSRLRTALVALQAALSVVLLVGATLFVRSLHHVQALDIGYDADRLLFGRIEFEEGAAPPAPLVEATVREVAQRLENRPGIEAVARANMEPMQGFSTERWFAGADSTESLRDHGVYFTAVSPQFFRAAGLRVLRGRGLSGYDAASAPAEVVVNEALAHLLWPAANPLGQCMRFVRRDGPCYEVVGVVENARLGYVIEERAEAQFYLPLGSLPSDGKPQPIWRTGRTLIVRTSPGAAAVAAAEMRSALQRAFPAAAATVAPMLDTLERDYRPWRLGATLFTAFGLLALLVALVGIYTTVSYSVSQRTHEFGVRVALGARVGNVLRQIVGEGMRTVAIGVVVGVALALASGRLIAALLYGIEPSDPLALLFVSLTILIVAALAALIPAWRAARVDPLAALRAE